MCYTYVADSYLGTRLARRMWLAPLGDNQWSVTKRLDLVLLSLLVRCHMPPATFLLVCAQGVEYNKGSSTDTANTCCYQVPLSQHSATA